MIRDALRRWSFLTPWFWKRRRRRASGSVPFGGARRRRYVPRRRAANRFLEKRLTAFARGIGLHHQPVENSDPPMKNADDEFHALAASRCFSKGRKRPIRRLPVDGLAPLRARPSCV